MTETPDDLIHEALEYAANARWKELALGAEFTVIDRQMLRELHIKATIAFAVFNALRGKS